jgi:hypothetical protein
MIYLHDSVHLMADLGADARGLISSADTEELHEFARRIGLQRGWFQAEPRHPHYDVWASRRVTAIACGAVEVHFRLLRDCCAMAKRESRAVSIQEVLTA